MQVFANSYLNAAHVLFTSVALKFVIAFKLTFLEFRKRSFIIQTQKRNFNTFLSRLPWSCFQIRFAETQVSLIVIKYIYCKGYKFQPRIVNTNKQRKFSEAVERETHGLQATTNAFLLFPLITLSRTSCWIDRLHKGSKVRSPGPSS